MVAELRIEGANQLAAVAKRLKAAGEEGKGLRTELLRGIREATKPVIVDVRDSAQATLPHKGGLADRVAASRFSTQTRTGANTAAVRIVGKSGYNISQMNRGRLRHPVFGHRDRWVTQSVRPNWFDKPIEDAADRGLRDAVIGVIDDVSRKAQG